MTTGTKNDPLVTHTEMRTALSRGPVIDDAEDWGELVTVMVGAGSLHRHTVATHMKVIGTGGRSMPGRRRIEIVDTPIYSTSHDVVMLVDRLLAYLALLSQPTVVIETSGMGAEFCMLLKAAMPAGVRVLAGRWGEHPVDRANEARFYTKRAQATIHSLEAIRDGAARLGGKHPNVLLEQATRLPWYIDENGRYHVASGLVAPSKDAPTPDLLDTVAMAFLEGVDFWPSHSKTRKPRKRVSLTVPVRFPLCLASTFFATYMLSYYVQHTASPALWSVGGLAFLLWSAGAISGANMSEKRKRRLTR